jgi:NAD(P)-dependent dehydrogenase (short-subunit alcohol dehydrogenase family)
MTDKAKTVVVTGASSGIGKATAQFFAKKGWSVVATMRKPAAETDLIETANLKLVPLDVQDSASVKAAVETALTAFGTIDVWVNNAGYGAFGPIEAASRAQVQRQYDVNVFGLLECVQAIAPHFRALADDDIFHEIGIAKAVTIDGYFVKARAVAQANRWHWKTAFDDLDWDHKNMRMLVESIFDTAGGPSVQEYLAIPKRWRSHTSPSNRLIRYSQRSICIDKPMLRSMPCQAWIFRMRSVSVTAMHGAP